MAWEGDVQEIGGSGGDLRPGYRPGNADDQLIKFLDMNVTMNDKDQMRNIASVGDDMLSDFVDRHSGDMSDAIANELAVAVKKLRRNADMMQQQGFQDAGMISNGKKLLDRILPTITRVLRHDFPRRREAFMKKQHVPRPAYQSGGYIEKAARETEAEIMDQVRVSSVYRDMQESTHDVRTEQDELEAVYYQMEYQKRLIYEWKEANQRDGGIYGQQIARNTQILNRREARFRQLVAIVNGTGFTGSMGRRERARPSRDRPWMRHKLFQQATAHQLPPERGAPSRSESMLRMRGGAGSASPEAETADQEEEKRQTTRSRSFSAMHALGTGFTATKDNYTDYATEDSPERIFEKFGVRVKGLVDLYHNYGHGSQFNPQLTTYAILSWLKFDAKLDIDTAIPEDVLLDYTSRNRRQFRKGTTLRQFLQHYSSRFPLSGPVTPQILSERDVQMKPIIGHGNSKGKTTSQRIPSRKLIEIFRKMKGKFTNKLAVQQLFQYKTAGTVPKKMEEHMRGLYEKREGGVLGRDRKTMQLLTPFFDQALDEVFWKKSIEGQTKSLKRKKGPHSNVNNWRDILIKFFGEDAKDLPARKAVENSYSQTERQQIWGRLSPKFQSMMKSAGHNLSDPAAFEKTMRDLQYHSAGLSPSPEVDYARRRKARETSEEEPEAADEESQSEPGEEPRVAREIISKLMKDFEGFPEIQPDINYHDTGEVLGNTLLLGFEKQFPKFANKTGKDPGLEKDTGGLGTFENQCAMKIVQAINAVDKNVRFLFPRKITNHREIDKTAQMNVLMKIGWNLYMRSNKCLHR